MKRRLFLLTFLACASLAGAGASARQQPAPREVPPGRVTVEEFKALNSSGKVIALDVRHEAEKKIKGALHIPLDELDARLASLPRDREVVTYCA